MKVFLVWFYDYYECNLVGVYSTLEKAQEATKEDGNPDPNFEIEEREVW